VWGVGPVNFEST